MSKRKRVALHEVSANHILGRSTKLTLQGPSSVVRTTANVINAASQVVIYKGNDFT